MTVGLGEVRHAPALGEVLPEQPVRVLVGPPFPRLVRRREVKAGGGRPLERCVFVKLGPVVDRDGPDRMRLCLDERLRPPIHLGARALPQLAEHQVPRLPLDQAQHARAGLARTQHGVRLPVAHLGARVGRCGASADRTLAGQAAPTVVAPVGFTPPLPGAAQVGVQCPPWRLSAQM